MAKKVIRQILFIYLTTTGIFLSIFFTLWYEKLYEELVLFKGTDLKDLHRNIVINIINSRFIPLAQSAQNIAKSFDLKFAIFDKHDVIFDNLSFDFSKIKIDFNGSGIYENTVFFVAPLRISEYFLGYNDKEENFDTSAELNVLIQGENVSKDLLWIRLKLLFFIIFAFLVFGIIASILVKIALRPLEDKISTLNRFIKDSTHEVNTPLSVILMSIEQLERQNTLHKDVKFARIKLAAKTLQQVYSDLVFSNFPNTLSSEKETFDFNQLLKERLEYFNLFFLQKKLHLHLQFGEKVSITMSKVELSKLLDNLLSNAIKYNKKGGKIYIETGYNFFSISDEGCGISKRNIQHIFERYTRFNTDQGGFGIGLSLVKQICDKNNLELSCSSRQNQGSTFVLHWKHEA
ncbi:HAMP domain-containing sensor histidine kinase [Campylobacter sp. MIT 21-1685]|uniref:sensor histidine kinase n=1 Tax=unclassified Campylobacter TaxID=2593542 RepID=UPI00224A7212|nr:MULTISPECIES: HAMP domain-containing sensor histidine kinase [unclassified Campylobacter]MCX2682495.1 HAMP domain-containing sensor histidine kinase [Campylobacter sp. MIT 21-1684]MCX2750792.1 HAMP domain-containing sensor histidine kinase [Campylobacter sp. MIT 21-1682]MCX2806976.1 HAMP domain-containing sensor histidine kinase [Campylobacter sp. MIT 21-1685]